MPQNPGQENANDDVVLALDTVGLSNTNDTRISPATEDKQDDIITETGKDFMLEVARNNKTGISYINKFGRNPDIDTGTDPEDIWDVGGLWVPPTTARLHNIASSSANDTGSTVSSGTATGGGSTTIVDSGADFVSDGVAVGDTIINDTNKDHGTVTAVATTTLTLETTVHTGDPGASNSGFASGDAYRVVNPTSTGASILHIYGLDANMEEQEEFVVLNGTNNVATANTYYRINRMHIDGAASRTVTNVGDISATAQTDATITAQINAGNGQTGTTVYTVPKGKTAFITNVYANLVRGKSAVASMTLRITPIANIDGAGSRAIHYFGLDSAGGSNFQQHFVPYKKILANTDIWLRVDEVTANDMDISGGFDLILVDN